METSKEQTASTFSKEYLEHQSRIISDLYSLNTPELTKSLPLGKNTRAAIYFKAMVEDTLQALYSIHELFYGEVDDKLGSEFIDAVQPLIDYADRYIINSISDNIRYRDTVEI